MNMTQQNLVSAADLRRLTVGSYEHRIESLKTSILDEVATKLGLSVESLDIVATYDDRAVVHTPDDKFYRVGLAKSDSGDLYVVEVALEQVGVVKPEKLGAYVESEVEAAVSAWLRGDRLVHERIADVFKFVPATEARDESQALATLESVVVAPHRPWRRLFEQRKSHLLEFVANKLESIEATRLTAKYKKLYDGSLEESKLDGYSDIVEGDLTTALRRLSDLRKAASAAFESARPVMEKVKSGSSETISLYSAFATDLLSDLAGVEKLAERATVRVGSVSGRGRLRDTLAESLYQYEIASRFVVEVANRLTKAA